LIRLRDCASPTSDSKIDLLVFPDPRPDTRRLNGAWDKEAILKEEEIEVLGTDIEERRPGKKRIARRRQKKKRKKKKNEKKRSKKKKRSILGD